MAKRYKYEYDDDGEYYDGTEKKPKIILILIGLIFLAFIIFLIFSSCSKKTKSSNNYLGALRVSNSELSKPFSKAVESYDVIVKQEKITISCASESAKASVLGCNESITVTEGSKVTHKITVTAEDGSTRTYILYLSKGSNDTESIKHTAFIEGSVKSGEETTSKVVLNAVSNYDDIKYNYQWYFNDKILEGSTSNQYIATESGKYRVVIVNTNNNYEALSDDYVVIINKQEVKTNDSYTLKINSVNGNPSNWVSSCTLTVSIDTSLGLASKAYSFDNGKTFQESNSKTFTSNQTVNIVVKDIKGHTVKKSVTISKIDTTKPNVSITETNKTNSSVKLVASINPSSTKSGYTYQWYKNGSSISGANSATYSVTSTGTYKVVVKTGAGLSSEATYNFEVKNQLGCPTLSVTTESGNKIEAKTWTTENIYVLIKPDSNTKSYDIYLNGTNNYSSISENYTYQNTYTSPISLKITGKGQRVVRIIVKDANGNSKTCSSKIYYLK